MWWGVHIVVIMAKSTVMWHCEYEYECRVRMYSVGILVSYIYELIYIGLTNARQPIQSGRISVGESS